MSMNLLQTIVDALPHPTLILDFEFKILNVNMAAEDLFETELPGLDFVRVLRHPDAIECLSEAAKTGELKTCDLVLRLQTPRTYKASAASLAGADNDSILFTLMDISAEIDAEKSRSTFVANVSHELRSPLTSLMGIVETLQGPARDDVKADNSVHTSYMREQIKIVGSSTVYPFATTVAENFGRTSKFKNPIVESTGSGGGLITVCWIQRGFNPAASLPSRKAARS